MDAAGDCARSKERTSKGTPCSTASTDGLQTFYLTLENLRVHQVNYLGSLQHMFSWGGGDVYVHPTYQIQPAIDAMVAVGRKVYLFQVVRIEESPISNGIVDVLAHLPPDRQVQWVWVIRP